MAVEAVRDEEVRLFAKMADRMDTIGEAAVAS
jgi:hypothetical protein